MTMMWTEQCPLQLEKKIDMDDQVVNDISISLHFQIQFASAFRPVP
jgi:hypothetical protein